ncbi:hypothetical protein DPMN_045272 [Dreissena polymorpha]|uniref:Uncharacterized protein n=1 Tax=Dreissena polymorpha TaxID=45954 RepID=A0A9D4D7G7_DREPO|nr:hypothetical protein DPMN_045272 [Dreissena polymorpha]
MNHSPSTIRLIVKTCCIHHNLMTIRYPTLQNALVDHDVKRRSGSWGMEKRSQLGRYQECQYQAPQHSNQKKARF